MLLLKLKGILAYARCYGKAKDGLDTANRSEGGIVVSIFAM